MAVVVLELRGQHGTGSAGKLRRGRLHDRKDQPFLVERPLESNVALPPIQIRRN